MTNEERKAALEAIIYAADEPATIEQLATALAEEKLVVQASLDELVASYAAEEHGVEVRAVAGGYKMYTKPQQHDAVRRFIKSLRPPLRLTMPALETLAVIAYKQPVTAPEIQEIRGVNTSGVLKTLLDKRLITTAGRKEVIGRPILYRSSKEFLMRFGLSDLDELPSLKEFEALAREALGSDEGFAPSGAGDESVLDGMPESGTAPTAQDTTEGAAATSESATVHAAGSATEGEPMAATNREPATEFSVNGDGSEVSALATEPAAIAESPAPEPAAQPEAAEQVQEETAEAHKTATAGE
jgi:segregation and condensation protein B